MGRARFKKYRHSGNPHAVRIAQASYPNLSPRSCPRVVLVLLVYRPAMVEPSSPDSSEGAKRLTFQCGLVREQVELRTMDMETLFDQALHFLERHVRRNRGKAKNMGGLVSSSPRVRARSKKKTRNSRTIRVRRPNDRLRIDRKRYFSSIAKRKSSWHTGACACDAKRIVSSY